MKFVINPTGLKIVFGEVIQTIQITASVFDDKEKQDEGATAKAQEPPKASFWRNRADAPNRFDKAPGQVAKTKRAKNEYPGEVNT